MKYLCDTNVVSEIMKRQPNVEVITWFEKFVRYRAIVIPVSTEIAKIAGELRGEFRAKGIIRTQADLLIAATALSHHLALATRNEKDFTECGLQILNPFR